MPDRFLAIRVIDRLLNAIRVMILYVFFVPTVISGLWTVWGVKKVIQAFRRYNPKSILDRRRRRRNWELEPFSRPRVLTIVDKQPICSQWQSRFFQLPLKIRQRIYCFFAQQRAPVHVWRTSRRLCSIRCVSPYPDGPDGNVAHWHCSPPLGRNGLVENIFPRKRVLYRWRGLLCSCRRMYSESVDVLYRSNVLHFDDPYNLHKLSESIPSQRLASIQYLHLEVLAFHNSEILPRVLANWKEACIVLVHMTGLQTLHVTLGADNPEVDIPSPRIRPLLEGLRKANAPEFLVKIPSNANIGSMPLQHGYPFVMVRREWAYGEWKKDGSGDDPRIRRTGLSILPPHV